MGPREPSRRGLEQRLRPLIERRFEGAVLTFDRGAEAASLRGLVESLSLAGFDIAIVSGDDMAAVDGELGARPQGPGELHLCLAGGSKVFVVDADGPRLAFEEPGMPGPAGDGDAGVRSTKQAAVAPPEAGGSVRWLVDHFEGRGLRQTDLLVIGDGLGAPCGVSRSSGDRAVMVELLADQLRRRNAHEVPAVPDEPGWMLLLDGVAAEHERAYEAMLTIADGIVGTNGSPLLGHPAVTARVLAAGVYEGDGPETALLACPIWAHLPGELDQHDRVQRVLDLRTGTLRYEVSRSGETLRALLFSSQARPGTVALRATGPRHRMPIRYGLLAPRGGRAEVGEQGHRRWMRTIGSHGGVVAAIAQKRLESPGGSSALDRIGAYVAEPDAPPNPGAALSALSQNEEAGFEQLLIEHREAWAKRWKQADVTIDGDSELQLSVRLALFHLMASVGDRSEAALGARGLTGPAYRGHVFWDSDVFVLPFLAATHPRAARAMLEYRLRRLPAARDAARRLGRAGARFPWESARTGEDVTPPVAHDRAGRPVPIRTGELEEHIVADVAWAASCYLDWTGDAEFAAGPGLTLFVETARYWASRIHFDRQGRGHIFGVIGPDEYHEPVDDNAYTNVMARWNLRRAADAVVGSIAVDEAERGRWLSIADALVDGYDPRTRLYEQFAGFYDLEPLLIEDISRRRPVAADVLLGHERVRSAQVVKQADVLMLHHLVPDAVAPGSLEPNLAFYEPRTAHGSSLSPGIHAALFARAGKTEEALAALRLTSRIDLDDLTQTTGGGLHMATMGSLWQALVIGFGGVRPSSDALLLDPRLPPGWKSLELRLAYRGSHVHLRIEPTVVVVRADPPCSVRVGDASPFEAGPPRVERRWQAPKRVEP